MTVCVYLSNVCALGKETIVKKSPHSFVSNQKGPLCSGIFQGKTHLQCFSGSLYRLLMDPSFTCLYKASGRCPQWQRSCLVIVACRTPQTGNFSDNLFQNKSLAQFPDFKTAREEEAEAQYLSSLGSTPHSLPEITDCLGLNKKSWAEGF